jgi:hypothetical protein
MDTTTFDMTAMEERIDAFLAEYPSTSGTIESRRAYHLIGELLRARGASEEERQWALNLLVASDMSEFQRGWTKGWNAANPKGSAA